MKLAWLKLDPRAGLLVVAGLLALLIVATSGWSHQRVVLATEAVVAGQAAELAQSARAALHPGRPDDDAMAALLAHLGGDVVWVGALGPDGVVVAQAGAAEAPLDRIPGPGQQVLPLPHTVRVLVHPASPPPRAPAAAAGPPLRPPPLVVEFRPRLARDLRAGSLRTLAVSSTGALLLVTAAAMFWSQWRRAEKAESNLVRQRNLISLGQVSAILAHEIRNPLASLKGHAQLLVELLPPGKSRTRATRVVNEAVRLEQLSGSLLDFARTASVEHESVDPAALASSVASDTDPERIVLDSDRAPERWVLDPGRLRQVLVNLLENALQASPEDTPVHLVVEEVDGSLHLSIRDHGPGIPSDLGDRIFEPFVTGRTRGTGLGLAVARRIVAMHGGSLTATNHPDGGALFTAEIP